ncbi:MAG: SpoIIE family protein phosphatase [Bacteroidota bacterium]|jgi:serine phosphatase RsbU (regulator of sigma subunit)|nr:SpoIIE family protein phosphatase [Bacteroidota bacterium]
MNGFSFFHARPHAARVLYIACLLAALAFASIWIVRFASIVTDENWYTDIDGKVTIVEVHPGGVSDRAGLRPGDVIATINGKHVRDKYDANAYLLRSRGGEPLVYGIVRDGVRMEITIYTAVYGLPLFYLAHILTGLAFIGLGTWVFLRRAFQPVARLYGYSHLIFGFTLLVSQSYSFLSYPDFITRAGMLLGLAGWAASFGVFSHLFLHFPAQRFVKPVTRLDLALLYLLPLAGVVLGLVLGGIFSLQGVLRSAVQFGSVAIAITAGQVRLTRRYRLFESVEFRQRFPLVRAGIIIALAFVAASLAVTQYTAWQAIFLVGLATPTLFFITIVRSRIFDLYVVVRRGSVYTTLTYVAGGTLILLFFLLLILLPAQPLDLPVLNVTGKQLEIVPMQNLPEAQQQVFMKRLYLTIGALALAAFWWLHRRAQHLLDERFYRGSYDYKQALTSFSKLSHSYADTALLARAVVNDLVTIMYLKGAAFALRTETSYSLLASNGLHLDAGILSFDPEVARAMDELFARGPAQPADNLPVRERFTEFGVEFLVAVAVGGRIDALILLGEKQAETNYSREDVELLDNLAINVADALMTMRFYESAQEKERMRKELEIARRIQLGSLPESLPDLPGIDMAAESLPAYEVGGDFYDFLPRYDATTLIIGDVSGKGTSAAMYLARIQGIMKTIESYQPTLWELFVRLNTQIFDHIEKRSFVTMAALRVELTKSEVTFLRAGHLPLLHYNALSRDVTLHQPPGLAVGLDRQAFSEQLGEERVFVRGGDIFVLLSDGITEAEDAHGAQFGIEGVVDCLRASAGATAIAIKQAVLEAVNRWTAGQERNDDQTLVVVKFTPAHSPEP